MGFDIECIPNIQSLPGEYFCPVCRLLIYPNEAVQSMCTHLYCKPCLAYVASTTKACPYDGYLVTETDAKPLVESNKVLADTIGKIVVHCLYQKSGCTWLGSLSESSSHCSGCAFGTSLVLCNWCGIQIAHRQAQEHIQVCPRVQQVHGQVVASAMLTHEQWYQQQYQQYYQNYSGYYIYPQHAHIWNPQQQLHHPSQAPQIASQHQAPYVQPAIQSVAQAQAQPQLQSQSLVMRQPHAVFPSAPHKEAASLPEAYPSVPPHSQDSSQKISTSQGLQNLQPQAYFQPTPLSQAHRLQNAQVPQYQQFHGQTNSQLHIQNPANMVQNSLPQNTTGHGQSHQPHAYWTPQPNQTNHVGVPPNNMPVYHQVGTQPPQVQNHFPQQQLSVPNQSTKTEYVKQLVLKYRGASVMHPEQQPWSKPSLQLHHTIAPTTDVVVNNHMHQGGPFTNPQIPLQSHLRPKGLVQGLQKHPQTFHVHQPITPNHQGGLRSGCTELASCESG